MKKVLIITQYFPPIGGVGVLRTTKFVKYLPEFDWEPIILTTGEDCCPKELWRDLTLKKDIPENVHIYRTKMCNSYIVNDQGIRWIPFLLRSLDKIIKKEQPSLVYLTGGPFYPLIAGPFIKFFYKLPYIVDLRDPWRVAISTKKSSGLKFCLGKLVTRFLEPLIIRNAYKVICVTKTMIRKYLSIYPTLQNKFILITNGFDPDDFKSIIPIVFKNFTIVYTGKFNNADPVPIFRAIKLLNYRKIKVQLIHIGAIESKIVSTAQNIGVEEAIKFIGPKSHSETLCYAMGANLLLVLGSHTNMALPVKFFDYIGCQRPVLVLAYKEEELAKFVSHIKGIKLIENDNPQAIANEIEKIYIKSYQIKIEKNKVKKYYRKNITHDLSQVFDKAFL